MIPRSEFCIKHVITYSARIRFHLLSSRNSLRFNYASAQRDVFSLSSESPDDTV